MNSPPGNTVFRSCIDEIILNCKNKVYKSSYLDITAGDLLGRMRYKYKHFTIMIWLCLLNMKYTEMIRRLNKLRLTIVNYGIIEMYLIQV